MDAATITTFVTPSSPSRLEPRISAREAAMLQLAPGVATLAAYAVLAALLARSGAPNLLALMIAILVAEVPVSWFLIVRRVRAETGGRFTIAEAFPWRAKVPGWQYLVVGIPLVLFSMVMIGGVGPLLGDPIRGALFAWVPEWFVLGPDPAMLAGLSRAMLMSVWVLGLVSFVLVGGWTQELYSRGFLLPRTAHLGLWAPAWNGLLFAAFHLTSPWSWPAFFVMVLPWAYLVWWKRSVKIGLFIHVGMLALQWLGMTMILFGVVPVPAS